jgi:TnpA family transposase
VIEPVPRAVLIEADIENPVQGVLDPPVRTDHGRGVMIYWHMERRAACIYSQLKRCSSSEVAAMIEGVLRHCADVEIQQHYVDSHGQSEVGFAFCHLLNFELAPRLKAIAR